MNETCGCCEGVQVITPLPLANRPGLSVLAYRVGTHATFLATMEARLATFSLEVPTEEWDAEGKRIYFKKTYPLVGLTTRQPDDPSIALLDAWAVVADVLTFYQERMANEGYLNTATERRSILELARLVGYTLRPGVASTVYLAYTLDAGQAVTIPAGSRAQSVPEPGEQMQSFETAEDLKARGDWNELRPRTSRPQDINRDNVETIDTLYVKGTATQLKAADRLLFVIEDDQGRSVPRRIQAVEVQSAPSRTKVTLLLKAEGFTKAVRQIAGRYLNLDAFGVPPPKRNPRAATVKGVLETLKDAKSLPVTKLQLSRLRQERDGAIREHSLAEADWIAGLVADFEKLMDRLDPEDAKREKQEKVEAESLPLQSDFRGKASDDVPSVLGVLTALVGPLSQPPSTQPANSQRLPRDFRRSFGAQSDTRPQLLAELRPEITTVRLYTALQNAVVATPPTVKVYALRKRAFVYGNNAQPPTKTVTSDEKDGDKVGKVTRVVPDPKDWPLQHETRNVVSLDAVYEQILPGSWIVLGRPRAIKPVGEEEIPATVSARVQGVSEQSRTEYGIAVKGTRVELNRPWLRPKEKENDKVFDDFSTIRGTTVYAQSELLELADEPIDPEEQPVEGDLIELDRLYDGLESGRWLVVSGERLIPGTSGVKVSELVMLADVAQSSLTRLADGTTKDNPVQLPSDKIHSTLHLANALAYRYKRDTVTVNGNVVQATHGETRNEVLGSGDGSKPLQQFTLRQFPLTHVSAPTPTGTQSTLQVRVNRVEWQETDSLVGLGPTDQAYITRTGDDDKTTVMFGDGANGARLPTGVENVQAIYRNGIGQPGNVKAGQISLLATRPLGVRSVVNPLPATGGADREDKDQAQRNVPLPLLTLERLVSVQDYESFARTFAGIGKARATRRPSDRRLTLHLTIAGAGGKPIDPNSDLYRNLERALYQLGDPAEPVKLVLAERVLLAIEAHVRLLPKYQWEAVEPMIRAALLDAFGFQHRDIGQPAFLSEAVRLIQQVLGVAAVDVTKFERFTEKSVLETPATKPPSIVALVGMNPMLPLTGLLPTVVSMTPTLIAFGPAASHIQVDPDQIAYLTPDVPITLILKVLTP